jgi:hypothetical protein
MKMNNWNLRSIGIGWLCVGLWLAGVAGAQTQKAQAVGPRQSQAYDVSRESVLQGRVIQFTAESPLPPLGAHVSVQTASGPVDVHIGSVKILENNRFTLAVGDDVKVVGENLPYGNGTQFFARLIEKGSQSIAVRGTRGFPLRPVNSSGAKRQGVAL